MKEKEYELSKGIFCTVKGVADTFVEVPSDGITPHEWASVWCLGPYYQVFDENGEEIELTNEIESEIMDLIDISDFY